MEKEKKMGVLVYSIKVPVLKSKIELETLLKPKIELETLLKPKIELKTLLKQKADKGKTVCYLPVSKEEINSINEWFLQDKTNKLVFKQYTQDARDTEDLCENLINSELFL